MELEPPAPQYRTHDRRKSTEARKFAMERLVALALQREPNRCKFSVEPGIQDDGQQLAEAKRSTGGKYASDRFW